MSYITKQETERVILPSNKDYWVDVLSELRWKEAKSLIQVDENSEVAYSFDQLLLALVKDWNLDDEEGKKLEINTENLGQLKRTDAEAIFEVVGAVVAQETSAQKKGL